MGGQAPLFEETPTSTQLFLVKVLTQLRNKVKRFREPTVMINCMYRLDWVTESQALDILGVSVRLFLDLNWSTE